MRQNNGSFPWRKAAATIALIVGAALLIAAGQNLVIRMVGLGIVLLGASLHADGRRISGLPTPSRIMWILGAISAVAAVISFHFLYLDALHGYHQLWPVYAFSATALGATGVWAALVARML
jgi:hypothetical protein